MGRNKNKKQNKQAAAVHLPFGLQARQSLKKPKPPNETQGELKQVYLCGSEKYISDIRKLCFDADVVVEAFDKYGHDRKRLRSLRRMIQYGTCLTILSQRYFIVNEESNEVETVEFSKRRLVESVKRSRVIKAGDEILCQVPPTPFPSTNVSVWEATTLDMAIIVHRLPEKTKIGILNFASSNNPGGGWERGSAAQEESLCRRSSLICSLSDPWNFAQPVEYPIPTIGAIYSPDVVVFRKSQDEGFAFLPSPFYVNAISIACSTSPPIKHAGDGTLRIANKSVVNRLRQKIMLVLQIAATKKITHLILGAWGCGVFGNPPDHIARLFAEALQQFQGAFAEVYFAIPDIPFREAHNPEGNLIPFSRVFKCEVQSVYADDGSEEECSEEFEAEEEEVLAEVEEEEEVQCEEVNAKEEVRAESEI